MGRLYSAKKFRSESRAIEEALWVRKNMTLLVALCLQKKTPHLSGAALADATREYMSDHYPYRMILDSFQSIGDKNTDQFMLNWGEDGGIWSEYIFGYQNAKKIIESRKGQIFLAK